MHQHREILPIDLDPRHKRHKMLWQHKVDFEIADGVRADGPIPKLVDFQMRKGFSDGSLQLSSLGDTGFISVEEVDMHVVGANRGGELL